MEIKLLIVDDDKNIIDDFIKTIQRIERDTDIKYKTYTANTLDEALEKFKYYKLDISIVDLNLKEGDFVRVQIFKGTQKKYDGKLQLVNTFGQVPVGGNVCYFNSLLNFAVAINQGNFSEKYKIYSGADWSISISK